MDIGGWTVDIMRIDNGGPAVDTCHSLEFGMIRCIDEVRERVRQDTGLCLTDAQVEQVLAGGPCSLDEHVRSLIRGEGRIYTERLLSAVMEAGFDYMMKYSMYKTFAAKYHTKVRKIRAKYRIGKDFGIRYETKLGWKTALFYNEGFRCQAEISTGEFDTLARSYFRSSPSSLIQKLKARKCEWCEAEDVDLEVHHVRRLKDLKGKAKWERAMIGRKRKTMVLCSACHDLLHAGKLD